ncbi:MAG TPA: glycosyltransferase [Bryobacteraceae bacterium]
MSRIGVMHLIDSLEAGGAERVAVDSVNYLQRDRYRPFLCATRKGGPLLDRVAPDVEYLGLERRSTVDLAAVARLSRYIRRNRIGILHAHSTSLFVALAATGLARRPRIVWHLHYGALVTRTGRQMLFRSAATTASAAIAVTTGLRDWAATCLRIPAGRVFYIPNFVPRNEAAPARDLPGVPGSRIVSVANLRPEKDQVGLVRAMRIVAAAHPMAHLIVVGASIDRAYAVKVQEEIDLCGMRDRITLLGRRLDVPEILAGCDVGVLGSRVEGFPVSLIEYGAAGLAAVATRVGQCDEILGDDGVIVPAGDPEQLAAALLDLLKSSGRRQNLGASLQRRVEHHYSPAAVSPQLSMVYEAVLRQ